MDAAKKSAFVLAAVVFTVGVILLFRLGHAFPVFGLVWYVLGLATFTACIIRMYQSRKEFSNLTFMVFAMLSLSVSFFLFSTVYTLKGR